jgi:hypothetical protein
MNWFALLFLLLTMQTAAAAYDANGVVLGSSEAAVAQKFPTATCQPLQWSTPAADRRCDDKAQLGGVSGRITFYLKDDRVQAFDLRFDTVDTQRLAAYLKSRYGAPASEKREKLEKRRESDLYRLQWQKDGERAMLTAQTDKRRGFFTVSRGDFEEQIYRLR